jgi:hypothetical protein
MLYRHQIWKMLNDSSHNRIKEKIKSPWKSSRCMVKLGHLKPISFERQHIRILSITF